MLHHKLVLCRTSIQDHGAIRRRDRDLETKRPTPLEKQDAHRYVLAYDGSVCSRDTAAQLRVRRAQQHIVTGPAGVGIRAGPDENNVVGARDGEGEGTGLGRK